LRFADVRVPEEYERGVVRGAIARITEQNKTKIKEDSWNRAKRTDAGPQRKISGKTVTKDKIISNFCRHEEMIIYKHIHKKTYTYFTSRTLGLLMQKK
jgi:hypothetical protein